MSGANPTLPAQPPPLRSPRLLLRAFLAAVAAFLLVVILASFVTFLLPVTFASTARVLVNPGSNNPRIATFAWTPFFANTQLELLRSEKVLGEVADQLDLGGKWAAQWGKKGKFTTSEVATMLKGRLEPRVVRNSSLIDITVYSERPEEAALIANKVAEVFRNLGAGQFPAVQVDLVERAVLSVHPARPNRPLCIVLGMGIGVLAALGVGSLVYVFQWRAHQARAQSLVPPPMAV